MKNSNVSNNMVISYLRIRTAIGVLGILLPFIILIVYGQVIDSISQYYYTKSSVFLTTILVSFGIFLICYKGYAKKQGEWLSDNQITHFAGIMALIVTFFPTTCTDCFGEGHSCIDTFKYGLPLLTYQSPAISNIHLICAGLFFIAVGYMAFFQFTKGKGVIENNFYRICGITIWVSIAVLIVKFVIIKLFHKDNFHFFPNDTYYLETIAIVAFGLTWLVKGGTIKHLFSKSDNNEVNYN